MRGQGIPGETCNSRSERLEIGDRQKIQEPGLEASAGRMRAQTAGQGLESNPERHYSFATGVSKVCVVIR
jgi:hypothetical protein